MAPICLGHKVACPCPCAFTCPCKGSDSFSFFRKFAWASGYTLSLWTLLSGEPGFAESTRNLENLLLYRSISSTIWPGAEGGVDDCTDAGDAPTFSFKMPDAAAGTLCSSELRLNLLICCECDGCG